MKMYVEIPDLPALYHEAEKILMEVKGYWQPAGSTLILSPNQHIYHDNRIRHLADQGHYFLVERGVLNYVHREKNVFYYEEGDFVGLFGEAEQDDVQIVSGHDEESVGLVPYAWDSLMDAFKKDTAVAGLWFRYLQILLQTFIAAEESRASILPKISPRVTHKEPGESITEQGEKSTVAYYILQGEGSVYSDGVLVGNVSEGELVGYMGILMAEKRTARIVADTPCDLLTITEDEFYSLLQVRPDLCKQLFKEMAQRIDVLNKQVSGAADPSAI